MEVVLFRLQACVLAALNLVTSGHVSPGRAFRQLLAIKGGTCNDLMHAYHHKRQLLHCQSSAAV